MAWQRGGPSRTSTPSHRAFRRTVLTRDHHTCQHCGHHDPTGTTLQADHILNHAQGGTDHPDNGQTLCLPATRQRQGKKQQPPGHTTTAAPAKPHPASPADQAPPPTPGGGTTPPHPIHSHGGLRRSV
ncbi:hypothetical protein GS426_12405 [Rhodococcus hoagii]|nr:hypothetical protein [Prescottella equi]